VLPRRKAEKLPKSFRLGTVDNERLWRLSARLGEEAGRPIAEPVFIVRHNAMQFKCKSHLKQQGFILWLKTSSSTEPVKKRVRS
jgi:hypothetical protein